MPMISAVCFVTAKNVHVISRNLIVHQKTTVNRARELETLCFPYGVEQQGSPQKNKVEWHNDNMLQGASYRIFC